ncbi:hypothetical protein BpHYR1_015045 [Brachionus plicatilis]|uniref:HTH psq-type domain-containing protein n=1 Tax=Brachionus plicatilis TaxID=10195 RepID=A0A3M7PYF9_BRAPC|nr:hypothetical protein BpHYR1_015045 [Brachionus plicatilis]
MSKDKEIQVKKKNSTDQNLKDEIGDVKSNKLNRSQAANSYGIPRKTLVNHLIGRYNLTDVGRPTVYSTQEEEFTSRLLRIWFKRWLTGTMLLIRTDSKKKRDRVNRFNPFGPHIINRGAKGAIQKFRENWLKLHFYISCHHYLVAYTNGYHFKTTFLNDSII